MEKTMAILRTKTTKDPLEIPDALKRNGAAKPADVEALLRIAQLEAQVARKSTLTLKVSEKGAVSLYGMGRFPVTLFGQQWRKVLDMADEIRMGSAARRISSSSPASLAALSATTKDGSRRPCGGR
jgi:hypothetical protein